MPYLFWLFFALIGYVSWSFPGHLFWGTTALVVYTYFGYPLILVILDRLLYSPIYKKDYEPTVTILIAAYNEEDNIGRKLENLLHLNYPKSKYDIIVASDGSTDNTTKIVETFANRNVKLVEFKNRRGKPSILNDTVPHCTGEIVVMCDARQDFDKNCLKQLAANFGDERVGAVSGSLNMKQSASSIGKGVDAYWRYEKYLRVKESAIHSATGGTGACLAIRKELYRPIPADTILDDVVIPLNVVRSGYRVVLDEEAIIYDKPSDNWEREFARKTRTLAGNYQILFNPLALGNPVFSAISFQYISHKILRLLVPPCLILMFIASAHLAYPGILIKNYKTPVKDNPYFYDYVPAHAPFKPTNMMDHHMNFIDGGKHLDLEFDNVPSFPPYEHTDNMSSPWSKYETVSEKDRIAAQPRNYFDLPITKNEFFKFAFFGQLLFYLLALLGFIRDRLKINLGILGKFMQLPYAFTLLHIAMIAGELRLISGRDTAVWQKAEEVIEGGIGRKWLTLLVDVILFNLAILLAIIIRSFGWPSIQNLRVFYNFNMPILQSVMAFTIFYIMGHHQYRAKNATPESLLKITHGVFLAVVGYLLLFFIKRDQLHYIDLTVDPIYHVRFSAWTLPLTLIVGSIFMIGWRGALKLIYERTKSKSITYSNVALITNTSIKPQLIDRLSNSGDPRRKVVGVITSGQSASGPISWLGDTSRLKDIIHQNNIQEIIVLSQGLSSNTILDTLSACDAQHVPCHIIPSKYDILASHPKITMVNYIPMMVLGRPELPGFQEMIKRSCDLTIGFAGSICALFVILFLGSYRLIKRQKLFDVKKIIGVDGELFSMLTFHGIQSKSPINLNSLLQTFNVISGKMSLVGPHPRTEDEYNRLEDWEKKYLSIKPGITGLHDAMSMQRLLMLESETIITIYYIRNYSILKDLAILGRASWNSLYEYETVEENDDMNNS